MPASWPSSHAQHSQNLTELWKNQTPVNIIMVGRHSQETWLRYLGILTTMILLCITTKQGTSVNAVLMQPRQPAGNIIFIGASLSEPTLVESVRVCMGQPNYGNETFLVILVNSMKHVYLSKLRINSE